MTLDPITEEIPVWDELNLRPFTDAINQAAADMAAAYPGGSFRQEIPTPTQVHYDEGTGTLFAWDDYVREAIHVRSNVVEAATRTAVIAELEALGYVVLGPYSGLIQ